MLRHSRHCTSRTRISNSQKDRVAETEPEKPTLKPETNYTWKFKLNFSQPWHSFQSGAPSEVPILRPYELRYGRITPREILLNFFSGFENDVAGNSSKKTLTLTLAFHDTKAMVFWLG